MHNRREGPALRFVLQELTASQLGVNSEQVLAEELAKLYRIAYHCPEAALIICKTLSRLACHATEARALTRLRP